MSSSTADSSAAGGRPRYTRLRPDGESGDSTSAADAAAAARRRRSEIIDRVSAKIHAFFWVVLAILIVHFTGMIDAVFGKDSKAVGWAVDLGFACIGIFVAIMLYLVIYVRRILGIDLDWQVYAPNMIPTATGAGVVAFLLFIIGLWPLYGLLTPLIVACLFLGGMMVTHFIPVI